MGKEFMRCPSCGIIFKLEKTKKLHCPSCTYLNDPYKILPKMFPDLSGRRRIIQGIIFSWFTIIPLVLILDANSSFKDLNPFYHIINIFFILYFPNAFDYVQKKVRIGFLPPFNTILQNNIINDFIPKIRSRRFTFYQYALTIGFFFVIVCYFLYIESFGHFSYASNIVIALQHTPGVTNLEGIWIILIAIEFLPFFYYYATMIALILLLEYLTLYILFPRSSRNVKDSSYGFKVLQLIYNRDFMKNMVYPLLILEGILVTSALADIIIYQLFFVAAIFLAGGGVFGFGLILFYFKFYHPLRRGIQKIQYRTSICNYMIIYGLNANLQEKMVSNRLKTGKFFEKRIDPAAPRFIELVPCFQHLQELLHNGISKESVAEILYGGVRKEWKHLPFPKSSAGKLVKGTQLDCPISYTSFRCNTLIFYLTIGCTGALLFAIVSTMPPTISELKDFLSTIKQYEGAFSQNVQDPFLRSKYQLESRYCLSETFIGKSSSDAESKIKLLAQLLEDGEHDQEILDELLEYYRYLKQVDPPKSHIVEK